MTKKLTEEEQKTKALLKAAREAVQKEEEAEQRDFRLCENLIADEKDSENADKDERANRLLEVASRFPMTFREFFEAEHHDVSEAEFKKLWTSCTTGFDPDTDSTKDLSNFHELIGEFSTIAVHYAMNLEYVVNEELRKDRIYEAQRKRSPQRVSRTLAKLKKLAEETDENKDDLV